MKISTKWAFIIHLNLSILIFASLVVTMWFYWFPGDLFFLDGGWQGLKLVAIIDLILGPLLTLILYKPGKKGLVFDMSAIALFQLAALGYGFYTTWQQQTYVLVYSEGVFNTVSMAAHNFANSELEALGENPKHARSLDDRRPSTVYIEPPNGSNMGEFLADIFNGYPEPQERSDMYARLDANHAKLRDRQLSKEELRSLGQWTAVEKKLSSIGKNPEDVELYRFKARYGKGVAVFSPEEMRIIEYVAVERPKPIDQPATQASAEEP